MELNRIGDYHNWSPDRMEQEPLRQPSIICELQIITTTMTVLTPVISGAR